MTAQPAISNLRPSTYALAAAILGILFAGAIFGFFYSWTSSVMFGFDAADPRVAIAAMQAVNEEIRNAVFFPAFFLTPIALATAGALFLREGLRQAGLLFIGSAVVYLLGGLILTMAVNVPMNEDLATVAIPDSIEAARLIWHDYSGPWQLWNTVRTVFSGLALLLAALGLGSLGRR